MRVGQLVLEVNRAVSTAMVSSFLNAGTVGGWSA